jgi:hypothetical protein
MMFIPYVSRSPAFRFRIRGEEHHAKKPAGIERRDIVLNKTASAI